MRPLYAPTLSHCRPNWNTDTISLREDGFLRPDDGTWLAVARYEARRNYNSPDDTRPFIAREALLDGELLLL